MSDQHESVSRALPPGIDPDGLAADLLGEIRAMPAIDCHEHTRYGHMYDWSTLTESATAFTGSLSALLLAPYVGFHMPEQVRSARFWEPTEIDSQSSRQTVIDALPRIAREQPSVYRANLTIPFADIYNYDINTLSLGDWDKLDRMRWKIGNSGTVHLRADEATRTFHFSIRA